MNIGSISLSGTFFTCTLVSVALFGMSCSNTQKPITAQTTPPPTTNSDKPVSIFPDGPPPSPDTIWAKPGAQPSPSPVSYTQTKPFSLRNNEKLVKHRVIKGENLSKIARAYGTTAKRIQEANGLSSDLIFANKTYDIPSTRQPSPAISMATNTPTRPAPPKPPISNTPTAPSSSGFSNTAPSPNTGGTYRPPSANNYNTAGGGTYSPPKPRNFESPSNSFTNPPSSAPKFEPRDFSSGGSSTTYTPPTSSSSNGTFPATFGPGNSF